MLFRKSYAPYKEFQQYYMLYIRLFSLLVILFLFNINFLQIRSISVTDSSVRRAYSITILHRIRRWLYLFQTPLFSNLDPAHHTWLCIPSESVSTSRRGFLRACLARGMELMKESLTKECSLFLVLWVLQGHECYVLSLGIWGQWDLCHNYGITLFYMSIIVTALLFLCSSTL